MQPYTPQFFSERQPDIERSARAVVPWVLDLVPCRSVVDVGCGDGTWLRVFQENGVTDVLGIDGDYVETQTLRIDPARFMPYDLSQSLQLDRTFDLVVSLEVAEHLPPEAAGTFLESLTRLGGVILFSAAAPYQGGTQHLNEQWPDYWAALFRERGYVPVDCIRPRIWRRADVLWWYAQNTLLFVRRDLLEATPRLARGFEGTRTEMLSVVHPTYYAQIQESYRGVTDPERVSLKWLLDMLRRAGLRSLMKRGRTRSR